MKIFLCLLLIKICSSMDSEQSNINNYWGEKGCGYGNCGYQEHGPIERPCPLYDVNCIKQFFARNSRCSPVKGPAPDPVRIKTIPMIVPHVNITFTLNDVEVKGYNNFKIKEFYINKATGRLVMEVEFLKLFVFSPYTVIAFYRKGKEPIVLVDYAFIEYRDLSLTLTAPIDKGINLSEAHVFTYISDANPANGLGPNFTNSKEPQVQVSMRLLIERTGLSLQEVLVTKGPALMYAFLQETICSY